MNSTPRTLTGMLEPGRKIVKVSVTLADELNFVSSDLKAPNSSIGSSKDSTVNDGFAFLNLANVDASMALKSEPESPRTLSSTVSSISIRKRPSSARGWVSPDANCQLTTLNFLAFCSCNVRLTIPFFGRPMCLDRP